MSQVRIDNPSGRTTNSRSTGSIIQIGDGCCGTTIFRQVNPASVWVISYNLGQKRPTVTVIDSTNRQVIPEEVIYDMTQNQIRVVFGGGFSGEAWLN